MSMRLRFLLLFVILTSKFGMGQIYYNSVELPLELASDSVFIEIERIDLIGNEKTRDYVILRELHFESGDSPSLDEIFQAQKRVLNTFLFNRVIFDLVGDMETGCILMVTVSERWYIFPVPIFYLNERSWDKVSYGAKLLYYNFLGRNILLNWTAAFGYDPQFKFAYRDLWFGGDLKLLTNFQIYKSSNRSRTLLYERERDERYGFDWLIGKRFGYYFYLLFQIGYLELKHPRITLSDDNKDVLPSVAISVQYDNRDLKEYPHKGFNAALWWRRVKHKSPINYTRYGGDIRAYIPVTTYTTLALRGGVQLSDGLIPLYEHKFLGYDERIRGQFYEKHEGENLIVGGV
ncbi:BamA/TamA family outer membrane protein, partial [candidate division KSB1 bacterium]|nr:BamA/TamA family outer membrane protein [candidate division KSB1 bacterium]